MSDPISRIGGAPEAPDEGMLADMFAQIRAKRGHVLNIHRVVGFAPRMLLAQSAYATALREESSLPRVLQELVILRVAQMNGSAYELSVHRPIAMACGATQARIDALQVWRDSSLFDERERAAFDFVDQAVERRDVDDVVFEQATRHFSRQEIVELAALVAWYVGNSCFVRALRIAPQAA